MFLEAEVFKYVSVLKMTGLAMEMDVSNGYRGGISPPLLRPAHILPITV